MAITREQAIAESIRKRATEPADEATYQEPLLEFMKRIYEELQALNKTVALIKQNQPNPLDR